VLESWFLQSGKVREKLENLKVREFLHSKARENSEGQRKSGIQKYQGAKVNKDAEKKTELLHAYCIQQFKIFSARFAGRLFVLSLLSLFRHPCF